MLHSKASGGKVKALLISPKTCKNYGLAVRMTDDEFEWDDRKAASNYAVHRVTFDVARQVFRDPFAIDELDLRIDYGEDRYVVIGIVEGRLLYVAYTLRGERIRIISARGAESHEQRLYHEADA